MRHSLLRDFYVFISPSYRNRRDFAPFGGFPFNDRCRDVVRLEPCLGTRDDLEQRFRLGITRQFGFALLLVHPQNGVIAVAVNGFVVDAHLVHQRRGVDDGKKFTDVIGAAYGSRNEISLHQSANQCRDIPSVRGCHCKARIDSPRIGPASIGSGSTVSFLYDGDFEVPFFMLKITCALALRYLKSVMPFLMIFATFWKIRRTVFSSALSAFQNAIVAIELIELFGQL